MPLLELSPTKKNQQTSESYALPSETSMVVERENSLNLSNFFIFMRRLLIWRSWGGVFGRGGGFLPVTPFRHCEPFYIHVIASPSLPVIARSEATKQSPLTLHPVIANQRVGKCAGVKQSPHCTFLLVLSVLRRLLRLIVIRLAMTRRKCSLAMTLLVASWRGTKQSLYFLSFFLTFNLFSQSCLVLNNNAYVVITGSRYVVINNSNANAITLGSGGGNIISEGELNRVKWNIGTSTGTYTIPFTKSAGNKIPLTVNITTAGIGSGSFLFSTYGGATWDNNTYRPSDVSHMNSLLSGGSVNNSAKVIDRFWIIDAQGYTTKPTVNITFTYLDAEWSASGNSITEANLFAQRFNSSQNKWADWFGQTGTCNTTNNTVSSGPVTPANFFRSWTLVDATSPLPVQWLTISASCNNEGNNYHTKIDWSTAYEINCMYYIIERSFDLISWDSIATISATNNGNTVSNYTYNDILSTLNIKHSSVFYRIKQVDIDHNYSYSEVVHANCGDNQIEIINIYPNPADDYFDYLICSSVSNEMEFLVTDVVGRCLFYEVKMVDTGVYHGRLDVSMLASGVYYFKVQSKNKQFGSNSKQILVK